MADKEKELSKSMAEMIDELGEINKKQNELKEREILLKKNLVRIKSSNSETCDQNNFDGKKFKVSIQKRLKVDYDTQKIILKLKERPEVLDTAIKKDYSIVDAKEFFKELRKYGVPAKLVKKYVVSVQEVDKVGLQELFDLGVIKLSDLEGAYSANVTTVVTVKEK